MASKTTTNLGLSQWVSSDLISMDDFNNDNKKIDTAFGNLFVPRIVNGTFRGTGAYGESSPKTLTFTFTPVLVVITRNSNYTNGDTASLVLIRGQEQYGASEYITWETSRVNWYSSESASKQMTENGVVYNYFALGLG